MFLGIKFKVKVKVVLSGYYLTKTFKPFKHSGKLNKRFDKHFSTTKI